MNKKILLITGLVIVTLLCSLLFAFSVKNEVKTVKLNGFNQNIDFVEVPISVTGNSGIISNGYAYVPTELIKGDITASNFPTAVKLG